MGDDYLPQNSQETSFVEDYSSQDSTKKLWIFLGISIAVVIVVLFIVLFIELSSRTISDDELSQGNFFNLEEDKEVKFKIGEEKHKIIVDSVYDDSIDIIIQSEIITTNIKIGETKEFDLDGDEVHDIQVKLESIEDGVPYIFIKKISKLSGTNNITCIENWVCTDWGICINKTKRRVCSDSNNCGTTINKPEESQACGEEENESIVLTCSEQNGTICNQTEICNGTIINVSDSSKCCVGDCVLNVSGGNLNETFGEPVFLFSFSGDLNGFINNVSENCTNSNILCNTTFDLFGIGAFTEIIIYYELQGMENDKCLFYSRNENYTFFYSEEFIQNALDSGVTQEEINEQLQITNQQYESLESLEGVCKYPVQDLVDMLRGWEQGNFSFSSENYQKYNCTGNLSWV